MRCQSAPGFAPTPVLLIASIPSMSHTAAWPPSSCQRMSALVSPLLNWPAPTTCHDAPGLDPAVPRPVTVAPSMSQIAGVPSSPCHRMSLLLSPLKSPLPLMCQPARAPEANGPTAPTHVDCAPFMSQIAGVPSSPCHRMSLLPSPLKSPVPITCQDGPGFGPTAEPNARFVPLFRLQIAAWPLSFCHRNSLRPSALKSPSSIRCQLGPTLGPTAPLNATLVSWSSHTDARPSSRCQRKSLWLMPSKL